MNIKDTFRHIRCRVFTILHYNTNYQPSHIAHTHKHLVPLIASQSKIQRDIIHLYAADQKEERNIPWARWFEFRHESRCRGRRDVCIRRASGLIDARFCLGPAEIYGEQRLFETRRGIFFFAAFTSFFFSLLYEHITSHPFLSILFSSSFLFTVQTCMCSDPVIRAREERFFFSST